MELLRDGAGVGVRSGRGLEVDNHLSNYQKTNKTIILN